MNQNGRTESVSAPESSSSPSQATGPASAKSGVEKTQSLLTIISTSIGILGAVGTGTVWLASTFYVGHLELKTEKEQPGMAVKVYTKEGHESVFHTKWIDLMPGKYHIEVTGPKGQSQHQDIAVEFNKTHTVNVSFPEEESKPVEAADSGKKKKRWYQFWKSDKDAASSDTSEADKQAAEAGRGFGIGDGFLEQPPNTNTQETSGNSAQEQASQQ